MQYQTRLIPPSVEQAGLVHTFYIIETGSGRIEEPVPAYSAQIILLVRGNLTMTFADGRSAQAATITINAPQMRAGRCVLDGPVLEVAASLTHVAWQRLANLPADQVHDQLIPASAILTAEQIAALEAAVAACRDGRIPPEALCAQLGAVIAAGPHSLRPDHVAVAEAILRWLGSGVAPDLADLHAAVGLSPRQLQRISRRFFGVAPAQVLKRFRAHRAAMALSQPGISEAVFDALMAGFFDQAHLIRDIKRYTGRTTTQLRMQSLGTGMLDPTAHGDAGAVLLPGKDPA